MFRMFSQFFTMLTTLFAAGEKLANAGDQLAVYAEEQATSFNEVARIERSQRVAKLKQQYASELSLVTKDGDSDKEVAAA